MSLAIDIYGSLVELPDHGEAFIEAWGTCNPKEQYWRRQEIPDFFQHVMFDKKGNIMLTEEQWEYAQREVSRCKHGFYFMNNGVITYITGKHYFFLQWWKLEDDIYPDYRDTDRRYYLFLNFWEHISWCLGIFRGKKRREGASSQATANLVYECIFFKKTIAGLVSKTLIDSRETFTDMVSFGYKQLPVFLQPKQLNDKDSVTEIVLAHKSSEAEGLAKVINEDTGHGSRVGYRAPAINAYDRGRLSRGLFDEGAKWQKDVPFAQFISIVTKTMVKGGRRVGFAECPSTVNEMTRSGGAEYKICWDNADQFKSKGKRTHNKFVRYFSPAYDGFEGFIDRYGMSVIDAPTEEQYEYLCARWIGDPNSMLTEEDIKMGAKQYLIKQREGLTGIQLEEEIRQNPFDEDEMFLSANSDCVFDQLKIKAQITYLEEHPPILRKITFYRDPETQNILPRDDPNSMFLILALPPPGQENKWHLEGRLRKPSRKTDGVIAVDGYSNSQGGRKYGSKACALIYRKFDINDPENTGMFVGMFYGRPSDKDILHEQVMMAAEYYGYEVTYEHTADDYLSFFRSRGRFGYLGTYPLNAIDPNKREKAERYKGFPITPFAMTKQLDTFIIYIRDFCHQIMFIQILRQSLIFDPYNRTESDCVVSAMIAVVTALDVVHAPPPKKHPIVTLYENEHYGSMN